MKNFVKLVLILVTVVVLVIFVNFYLLQVEKPEPSSDVTPPQDLAPLQQEQENSPPPPTQLPPVTIEPSEIDVAPKPLNVTSAPVEDVATLQGLRTRIAVVDWETARRHTPLEPGLLSESQQSTVDSIDVPVLLPNNSQILKSMILTSGKHRYGASMDDGNTDIFIRASAKRLDMPELFDSVAPLYGDHQRGAQQIEGIMELDFEAFGIVYSMSVECSDWQNDPRCTEKEYILEIADELVMAGGNGFKKEME